MGGLFGAVSRDDCIVDLFFGTDYHSHLGTKRGGMCVYDGYGGFNRSIHNIENSPFRTKFENEVGNMVGKMGIGAISDGEPQPLNVYSRQGHFAIGTVGRINNKDNLVQELIRTGCHQFMAMSSGEINNTELVAALISSGRDVVDGIHYAQEKVEGSITMLVLTPKGLYAARDKYGRTPMIIGKKEGSYCAASESFSFVNLGYQTEKELGPGEIVLITANGMETVQKPYEKMRICTFLWTYFGYTTTTYEGENVEKMRYRNGGGLARDDIEKNGGENLDVDYVAGVPDSGTAHALGYAAESKIPYARPLIKYTPTWPRSFMPPNQTGRDLIAKMKLVPVRQIIEGKKFVLVDDSIVRGTQLSGTAKFLKENKAKEIHVRSACPPIMYPCKFLNFSRSVSDKELITRRVIEELEGCEPDAATLARYADESSEENARMVERIREKLDFDDLRFHTLSGMKEAVGIEPCKLCTYCWDGKE